jgi:TRAP transporter TAXI family solute receptor
MRLAYDAIRMVGRRTLLSFLATAAVAPTPAVAQQQARVTIGTTSLEGGGYALYSAAFLDMLKTVDPLLEVRVVQTTGSTENAELLKTGDIDIGLVSGEVAHELLDAEAGEASRVRVVSVMYASPGMFAVRADSRFHRIADLAGRPIAWNIKGSGVEVQARYVMDGLGLDMDHDFQPIYQERFSEAAPLVMAGQAAALWGSGFRWPPFVQLADTAIGARFVYPDATEIARIRAKYPFMVTLTVPAGLYPGQYDPIETIGTWSFILARADLSNKLGARLASALSRAEHTGVLTKQLGQTTVANTLAAIASPDVLQPGVAVYYRKVGLMK